MTLNTDSKAFPRQQRGASAVEFAFVFPILFLLVYGVIVYSYVYVVQQSITFSAQQLAEVAVAVNPIPESDLEARIEQRVQAVAARTLRWMPDNQRARVFGAGSDKKLTSVEVIAADQSVVKVRLEFQVPGLFPTLELPLVGNIPPLPQLLVAEAVARI